MHFVRSHGLGNDYLVVDPAWLPWPLNPARVRRICDRHRGVGSDGILERLPSATADAGVRIWNPDGSVAEKSGNGIRIFAKFLRDHGLVERDAFAIETAGGVVAVELERAGGRVTGALAAMGRARFEPITSIEVAGHRLEVTALSVGNPHCVVLVPDLDAVDVHALGPLIERHPAFPDRTNVQFAQVRSRSEVEIRIWERGAGYTLASGSSSCAVAAACHRLGLVDERVSVRMPGGRLEIAIDTAGDISMRGPVEEICTGELSPDLLAALAGDEAG